MKKNVLLIIGIYILVLVASGVVFSYNDEFVIIEPSNPTVNDDITCKGFDNDYYYFVWLKNGIVVKSNTLAAQSLTLTSENTNENDTLTCIIYLDKEHRYELGERSVTIPSASSPSYETKAVSITPKQAYSFDNLTCDVTTDNDLYYYVWQVNGITKVSETFAKENSVLKNTFFSKHDVVKCLAYYDSRHKYEVGSDSLIIQNSNPVAIMQVSKTQAMINEPITFDASESYDLDEDSLTYLWDFGDGTTSNEIATQHAYSSPGNYIVTLTVSDGEASNSTQKEITITEEPNNKPNLNIEGNTEKTIREGQTLTFYIEGNDTDNDNLELTIFGKPENAHFNIIQQTPGYIKAVFNWTPDYNQAGTYEITFTLSDGKESIIENITITVENKNREPVAVINVSKTEAYIGESITFNASQSYDPDNDSLTYLWDFGDGTTSNEIATQHAYSSPGNYIVTLTVSDGEYNVSQSITLTINANLVISEVNCFDKVTRGKKQVCSVKVENNINQAVGNAVVRIIDTSRNIELANCITDDLSGGCSAEFTVSTPNSTQEIKVEAHKNGYDDATPRFLTFEVLDQRYELREFEIFNDANYSTPSTTFYRGDSVYVKFKVYDLEEGKYTTDNVITQATLISYDAGGYILLENDSNADSAEPEYKHFKVEIPLSHFFIGESAVFGFAINFVDNSMGQADKKVTILNNPPEIVSEIPTITITEINQTVTLNLSDYAYDKEDGTALEWQPYSYYSSLLDIEVINGSLLKIKPKAAVQVPTKVILRVYDLDNDYASTTVTILLNITNNPPQPPAECFVGETRKCGPETDKGICEYGIQRCIDGHWGECVGAVYPQPEVENGLDDNCNGLIDEGFTKTSRDEIGFGRITYTSELNAGGNLNVNVNLENKKGEDVQFSVLVLLPELGIGKRVLLNADAGESVHRFIQLEIPKNVKPGDYLLRISVNNGEFNRIKHRIITIR